MPRLIDADKIKLPQGFFEKVDNVPKFYEWLNKLPTVDAVPVVRCKDCIHLGQCTTEIVMRRNVGSYIYFPMGSDGFCSWGGKERR